jgi:deoxyadenosine/deoxycytidine kinase
MAPPVLVAVEGNIGSGKTTLLRALETKGHKVFYENIDLWMPALELFYTDPSRWSFTLQVAILKDMHRQREEALKLGEDGTSVVFFERSPQSSMVFTIMSYARDYLNDVEMGVYKILFDALSWVPDVTVLLETPVGVCMRRIQKRSRNGEGGIQLDYLQEIEKLHHSTIPVFHITLDGRKEPNDLAESILVNLPFKVEQI